MGPWFDSTIPDQFSRTQFRYRPGVPDGEDTSHAGRTRCRKTRQRICARDAAACDSRKNFLLGCGSIGTALGCYPSSPQGHYRFESCCPSQFSTEMWLSLAHGTPLSREVSRVQIPSFPPSLEVQVSGNSSVIWQRSRFGSEWSNPLQVQFLLSRPSSWSGSSVLHKGPVGSAVGPPGCIGWPLGSEPT